MSKPRTRLPLDGELTIFRAAEVAALLQAAIAGLGADGDAELELDLAAVTALDSAGVQLLLAAKKSAQAKGGALRVTGHSAAVLEVFDRLNLAGHFGDVQPAPAALAQ